MKDKLNPSTALAKFIEIPIGKLVKAGWNYKEDDDRLKEKLKENLKRNGQIENCIIRELPTGFYEIVNGNHRYDAMGELGFKSVVCYNLGVISDAAAMRIAIETNETRFATDQMKLAERIKELSIEFPMSDLELSMPFDERELTEMANMVDFDWDKFNEREPKDESDESEEDGTTTLSLRIKPETLAQWEQLKETSDADGDDSLLAFAVSSAIKALGRIDGEGK